MRKLPRLGFGVSAVEDLERAFGAPVRSVGERNWPDLAERLTDYLLDPTRAPVLSFADVERALRERWRIPVVEISETIGSMGPLREADPEYGRCGVRLLDLMGESQVYIVVRARGGESAAVALGAAARARAFRQSLRDVAFAEHSLPTGLHGSDA
jgi:hypothetical protein